MSSPKPLPDPNEAPEDPPLRLFLDRAMAIVQQHGGLNAKSRILLGSLADEMGIRRSEAEPAIHTLLLATEDFSPKSRTSQTPPSQIRRPPPLPKTAADSLGAAPSEEPLVVMIDDNAVVQNFIDKAAYVLAQHGGWNPKTRVVLMQLAQSMGVTGREMETALTLLQDAERGVEVVPESPLVKSDAAPEAPPLETQTTEQVIGSTLTSTSAAEPPRPPRLKPRDVYECYLRQAIQELRRPHINSRRERRLIEQGVHKLGLSPVYAMHLLSDVAEQCGVLIESQQATLGDGEPQDDQTAEFLRRARAIIAEQRGVTMHGQIKISAAAQELGLDDEAQQRALSLLQNGVSPQSREAVRRDERLVEFRAWLHQAIAALPRKFITPDVAVRLVETGVDFHGVEATDGDALVREIAKELEVRFVSHERAYEHIARLVRKRMAGASVLRHSDRDRIFTEGGQWGLSPAELEAIVAQQVELNRQTLAMRRRRSGLAAAIGATIALSVVVAWFAWRLLRDPASTVARVDDITIGGASKNGEAAGAASPASPDDWWDFDLSVAMTRAEVELHYLNTALADVRSLSPQTRAQAYEHLLDGLPRVCESRTATSVLQEIVAGCYALDPSDEASQRLREQLLEHLPQSGDSLPKDTRDFQQAYAAVQMAAAALTRVGVSEERSVAMQRALERELEFTLTADRTAKDAVSRQCLGALTRILYQVVIAGAKVQPFAAQPLHAYVAAEAPRSLDAAVVEQLEAQFLKALLSSNEEVWRQHQSALLRMTSSNEPSIVLQAVELLEWSKSDDLRYFLAARLLHRIGVTAEAQSFKEVARLVREKFGVRAVADTTSDVKQQFIAAAAAQLAALGQPADQPLALVEETVQLARLSAMGCALSQGEMARTTFDELASQKPFTLPKTGDTSSPQIVSGDAVANARAKLVGRYIESLERSNHPVQRLSYFKGVVENAEHVVEIEPHHGAALARYLLATKPEEERHAIDPMIPVVGRWKMVRLGIADLLAETTLRQEVVQILVGRVLEESIDVAPGDDWKANLRQRLLRSVAAGGAGSTDRHPFDAAQHALRDLYIAQAKALGAPLNSYSAADSPSEVLTAIINQVASRKASGKRSTHSEAFLARLPHELAVVDFLATDDLRRYVLLERVWLRLLESEMAERRSPQAGQAHELVESLLRSDAAAGDLIVQLRDGQAALLRMWLLRVQ